MAKILVTGGAGYIGSHTVHLLRRRGYEVVVVDDLSRGHEHNVDAGSFHRLNLLDTEALTRLLTVEKCEAVIHFAAYIAVGESTQNPELYFTNNVSGSISLFTSMNRAGIKRLVFSSTAAVYGTPERVPITEDFPYAPVSPYGDSKVMVEKILAWLDEFRGLRSICLRYFNACGAEPDSGLGEEHDPETHLIPLLLRAIDTGQPVTIFGEDYETPDGTCIRDYVHVSDLAEAHILAVESLMKGATSNKFNVGTGEGRSVREVMRAVEEVTGQKIPYKVGATARRRSAGTGGELGQTADDPRLAAALCRAKGHRQDRLAIPPIAPCRPLTPTPYNSGQGLTIMAANPSTLVSVEEYLNTSYEPDCDYVDGVLEERNLGESDHSQTQAQFTAALLAIAVHLRIRVMTEQRLQVRPNRFRVPDICVVAGRAPLPPILTDAPAVCIEILSRDDRMHRVLRRADDYVRMGVQHIWLVDPRERIGYTYSQGGLKFSEDGVLSAPEIGLTVNLGEIFAAIDAE